MLTLDQYCFRDVTRAAINNYFMLIIFFINRLASKILDTVENLIPSHSSRAQAPFLSGQQDEQ